MSEFPVVENVPSAATAIGPIDCAPSGNVMIMFTVDFVGRARAATLQTWSRAT
jgi:hypothetical protein